VRGNGVEVSPSPVTTRCTFSAALSPKGRGRNRWRLAIVIPSSAFARRSNPRDFVFPPPVSEANGGEGGERQRAGWGDRRGPRSDAVTFMKAPHPDLLRFAQSIDPPHRFAGGGKRAALTMTQRECLRPLPLGRGHLRLRHKREWVRGNTVERSPLTITTRTAIRAALSLKGRGHNFQHLARGDSRALNKNSADRYRLPASGSPASSAHAPATRACNATDRKRAAT